MVAPSQPGWFHLQLSTWINTIAAFWLTAPLKHEFTDIQPKHINIKQSRQLTSHLHNILNCKHPTHHVQLHMACGTCRTQGQRAQPAVDPVVKSVTFLHFLTRGLLCFERFRAFGKAVWHVAGILLAQSEAFHASATCTAIALWTCNQFYCIFKRRKIFLNLLGTTLSCLPAIASKLPAWDSTACWLFFFFFPFEKLCTYFCSLGFEWPWQTFPCGKQPVNMSIMLTLN